MRTLPVLYGAIGALFVFPAAFAQSAKDKSSPPKSAPITTVAAQPATPAKPAHPDEGNDKPDPHSSNPNASEESNAVQAVLHKFDSSRDQLVSARQTLIDKVAAAKDDNEREAALRELRDEQKSMEDVQRTTAKEIRAELENLRRQRAGGG